MTSKTYTYEGDEYIFPPDQVCKPEKTTEKEDEILWNGGEKQ